MKDLLNNLLREKSAAESIQLLGNGYDYSSDEYGALNAAIWYSCNDFVNYAVSKGAPINKEGLNGTPLGIASLMGNLKLVEFLIANGADIDQQDKYGDTAISKAAGQGNHTIIKLLIKANANLFGALSKAVDGGYVNIVKVLLQANAPVNEIADTAYQMTPLLRACSKGKKKGSSIALLLLDAGADASYVRQSDGMSAIKFALWGQCDQHVLLELQKRGAPLPEKDFKIIRLV